MRRVSLLLLGLAATIAYGQPKFTNPDRIRYDGQCFTIDGKDTFLFSGAFHYFRCPKELWRERFQAIKDAGFNAVETYVAWNWSERERPKGLNDFSKVDLKDLDEWLTMAEDEFGLYTIVRPGPYICSEWATGGLPNWLITYKPAKTKRTLWYRSDDPVFEDWSHHWFRAVAKVVDKHQLTRRPVGKKGMILWQVENEYDFAPQPEEAKRNYVRDLIRESLHDGIEVPIFGCWTRAIRDANGDPLLSEAFDNPNQYPGWNIDAVRWAIEDQHKAQPWAPKMVTEFQGGWFGQVGGLAAEEQDGIDYRQTKALTLNAIQNGLTGLNYYMLFGGTNLGDWGGEGITTSYDYFAPIREWGGRGPKYRAVQAVGRMLRKYGSDLARSTEIESPFASDKETVKVGARKGLSGATYLFVRNTQRNDPVSGTLGGVLPYQLREFGMDVYRYTTDPKAGEWVAHEGPTPRVMLPAPIRVREAQIATADPTGWKTAPQHATNDKLGIWDSRFLFYRAAAPAGSSGSLYFRTAGGELVSLAAPSRTAMGGQLYAASGGSRIFALLNSGWPNGGSGMEAVRGVSDAKLIDALPHGTIVSGWKGKVLANPNDRSLVGQGVDTTGWVEGAPESLFQVRTSVVIRATVRLSTAPAPDMVLNTEGVDDDGWFYVNGRLVGEIHNWGVPDQFPVAKYLHSGDNDVAIVIRNNDGPGGLTGAVTLQSPLPPSKPFTWQWTDRLATSAYKSYALDPNAALNRNEHPKVVGPRRLNGKLIVRSRVRFARPGKGPWEILIKAGGDGFLTLNGKPLGRFWEVGPQRGFYLPQPMLRDQNVLELTAIPGRLGDRIFAAELRPLPMDE